MLPTESVDNKDHSSIISRTWVFWRLTVPLPWKLFTSALLGYCVGSIWKNPPFILDLIFARFPKFVTTIIIVLAPFLLACSLAFSLKSLQPKYVATHFIKSKTAKIVLLGVLLNLLVATTAAITLLWSLEIKVNPLQELYRDYRFDLASTANNAYNAIPILLAVIAVIYATMLALRHTNRMLEAAREKTLDFSQFKEVLFSSASKVADWVIQVTPCLIFIFVAQSLGNPKFGRSLTDFADFYIRYVFGLVVLVIWLLGLIWLIARKNPFRVIQQLSDPIWATFASASSAITLPMAYSSLINRVQITANSAQTGTLLIGLIHRCGSAFFIASAVFFAAKADNHAITSFLCILIISLSVLSSIFTLGFPHMSFVAVMLVCKHLNIDWLVLAPIFAVEGLSDRLRSVVNLLGSVTVACILDETQPDTDKR